MVLTVKKLLPLFIYASQKGTAQGICEDLHQDLLNKKVKCELLCISQIKELQILESHSCVIFVVSTTGDGEPPDTAVKFMRKLKGFISSKESLSSLFYTVLGLGDTNYTNFCNFGKTLDETLQLLSSKRFYNCGWADDGTGLEIVVEPWIEGLFPAIELFLSTLTIDFNSSYSTNTQPSKSSEIISKTDQSNIMPIRTRSDISSLMATFDIIQESEITEHAAYCSILTDSEPSIPSLPGTFLNVDIQDSLLDRDVGFTGVLPLAASDILYSELKSCKILTSTSSPKKVLEILLQLPPNSNIEYEPGDTFGILAPNPKIEVDLLLCLLGLEKIANNTCHISLDPLGTKKNASIPSHLPSHSSLRYIFSFCVEIRSIPKKPFIRALIEHTTDSSEKKKLMELVSKECSQKYMKIVREGGLGFLDFLILFKSCCPPVQVVLEHLPRLLPRPYSITSSPLETPSVISFVFNVINIKRERSITYSRKGLCSGWLDGISRNLQSRDSTLDEDFQDLSLSDKGRTTVPIYFRTNHSFRLPKEISIPIIMIGPGTGVAPFIGFLRHRHAQLITTGNDSFISCLFFGCRKPSEDFLYKKELLFFESSGSLKHLFVCFSQDGLEDSPKYVQDNIRLNGAKLTKLLFETNTTIYVCGEAKNMPKGVFEAFVEVLKEHKSLSESEARQFLAQLQLDKRYLQDVWA